MYLYAWKQGLKTTYYLRSRPATRIQQATVEPPPADAACPATAATPHRPCSLENPERARRAVIACSLENPESCEACQ